MASSRSSARTSAPLRGLGQQLAEHDDAGDRDVAARRDRSLSDGQHAFVGDRFEHAKDRDLPIAFGRGLEGGDELRDDAAAEDRQAGDRRFATVAIVAQGLQQGADVVCRQPSGPSSRIRLAGLRFLNTHATPMLMM